MMITSLLLALFQGHTTAVAPKMSVSPTTSVSISGPVGGGGWAPATQQFVVSNKGIEPMSYTVTTSANWITLTGTVTGTLGTNRSTVITATPDSDADNLAVGSHVAPITFTNVSNGNGSTSRDLITMVTAADAVLTPDTEWGGATSEPGQIGTGTAKCIARWDVVPHQVITEATTPTFTVGVVAFHIAGIEKVSFAVEGGAFVDVTEMTLNPFTNVWEYCATIELADFAADEEIELRAIAYPNAAAPQAAGTGAYPGGGYPRLLDSLLLYVDADAAQAANVAYASSVYGSDSTGDGTEALPYQTVWKAAQLVHTNGTSNAGGGIVYLDYGSYTLATGSGTAPSTANRWLTVSAKPGVDPQTVLISMPYPGFNTDKLRLDRVRCYNEIDGVDATGRKLWISNASCVGTGIQNSIHGGGWFPAWQGGYWLTDMTISDDTDGLRNPNLARNVTTERVQRGGLGFGVCIINWTIRDTAPYNGNHTSVVGLNVGCAGATCPENSIYYGVVGTNLDSGHFHFKDTTFVKDFAFVNVSIEGATVQGTEWGENCGSTNHLLLWNVTHRDGGWAWRQPQSEMSNISIRGVIFRDMGLSPQGDAVPDSWFDNCHYVGPLGITPGTNVTTGDPGLDASFRPTPNSPLNNRMTNLLVPVDADGVLRTVNGSVGAYEVD